MPEKSIDQTKHYLGSPRATPIPLRTKLASVIQLSDLGLEGSRGITLFDLSRIMVLPGNLNTGGQRVKFTPLDTTTFKTRLEPRKHRPPSPSTSTSSPPSHSVPYHSSPNMFTTPTKATSRMANKSPFNKVNFTMRRTPIVASPFISPGGHAPFSPPSLFQCVNSPPVATPTRRRYSPTRFLSPKIPKSHRGRAPAQSQPRKERSFQSLEKSVLPPAKGDPAPSFNELTEKVHTASAKAKVPNGQEADIFFVQLGRLNSIHSITSGFVNAHISSDHAAHDLESHRKPRREHQLFEGVPAAGERLSKSPQKREAIFMTQRKQLREEAIMKEEFGFQRREPDSKKAGPSQEHLRQSPESVNKLKRKQQAQEEEEAVREKAYREEEERNAASADRASEEESLRQASARLRQHEEAARLQAQDTERLQRYFAEVSRLRAEEDARLQREAMDRRRMEEERKEQDFQERLRKQAQFHAEQEEKARRLEAEEEVRRKAEVHARWRLQEQTEQSERLEKQAREEAQQAHLQAEQARAEAEHALLLAEHIAEKARLHAEEQARIHAEQQAQQQARLFAEQEARRQAEFEANFRAYEREQALAAEEARIRAIAESVAQMQAELNARAQAAFGGGASWHHPHEHYEFNRHQQQQQEQQNHYQYQQQQQQHQHQRQQPPPSPEFHRPHQQTSSQQHQQQSYQHHDTDVPMRDPSLADINMDASMSSIPDECPTPIRCSSPEVPPPPPPPPAPLTKSERVYAYHAKWKTPIEQWGLPIGFQQFPWPVLVDVKCPEDITFQRLREFYLYQQNHISAVDHRKTARAELKRWHSDKIDGKFSGKLDGSKPMIDAAVKEITRFLHEVLSNM